MRRFLEGRIQLVRQLSVSGPEVTYADLVLILTAVLSACAASRWRGVRIDKLRFIELLVNHSPPEARTGYISLPALVNSELISEGQTPWGEPGQSTRIFRGEEIDCDLDSAALRFPAVSKGALKQHCYACLIYEWLRCGYAHEYCASKWVTMFPPSRRRAQVSYIGRITSSGLVRMSCFHLDYLIQLAEHHVAILPEHEAAPPSKWWLNVA